MLIWKYIIFGNVYNNTQAQTHHFFFHINLSIYA